ncbi:hypothetical protein [Streptomyces lavendulocolor]|uniref:hypothetical protein n=1 Tax=Streptomyces lavendulocolor TaxID=67316 RepID=UPI0033CDC4C3
MSTPAPDPIARLFELRGDRVDPTPCRGCQYFTGPSCWCDNQGYTEPQCPQPEDGADR